MYTHISSYPVHRTHAGVSRKAHAVCCGILQLLWVHQRPHSLLSYFLGAFSIDITLPIALSLMPNEGSRSYW